MEENGKIKKRNCEWLQTTHDRIEDIVAFVQETQRKLREFQELLGKEVEEGETQLNGEHSLDTRENPLISSKLTATTTSGIAFVKFEPMVLHVQCLDLEAARRLHLAAVESGFKNSGLSVGKKKIIAAVRSSHSLEVPISDERGHLIVSEDYLRFVVKLADEKLAANFQSIERLRLNVEKSLSIKDEEETPEEES